jgi:large subunit ribosomal protein L3
MKALITRKVGMTSCVITQVKTADTDGYQAVQLGFEEAKRPNKAQAGHNKNAKVSPKVVREFRITGDLEEGLSVGSQLAADVFIVGDAVQVTGTTKGKGFAGTIKRHNMHRGRKTHGGRSYRRPGSIGSMYPQKIFKGKHMAGRMGHDQVTTKNLTIALVDTDLGVIGVTGAVPGPRKGIILLQEVK